jgi:transposase
VGQGGGPKDRLAEADAAARVRSFAEEVVVERTFSWLGQNRRMSKDYERLCASAEAFVYAAMIRLMVRQLARG